MEVKDITIGEYFTMKDTSEYDVFFNIMKPENKLCGQSWRTNDMTFNEFKTIILIFNDPILQNIKDLFVHLYKIRWSFEISPDELFFNESVFQFFKAYNFVKQYVKDKLDLEAKMLYSEPDGKMIEIGAYERLRPFQTLITKINLATQFGVKPSEIGEWKYNEVLNILSANNVVKQIEAEYRK